MGFCAGGSRGWDDSGNAHAGLQECDCASTIDRLIQHKDMCAGQFACDADACNDQWKNVWGASGYGDADANDRTDLPQMGLREVVDTALGHLLQGAQTESDPNERSDDVYDSSGLEVEPRQMREIHQLLRCEIPPSVTTHTFSALPPWYSKLTIQLSRLRSLLLWRLVHNIIQHMWV